MARKTDTAAETYNSIFAVRLRTIMEERRENQTTLAKKVGLQRQTISLYTMGQSKPDTDNLTRIAKALDVSSDWLLGISDFKNKDNELIASESLGLTEKTISTIHRTFKYSDPETMEGLNELLSDERFYSLTRELVLLKRLSAQLKIKYSTYEVTDKDFMDTTREILDGNYTMSAYEVGAFLNKQLIDDFEMLLNLHTSFYQVTELYHERIRDYFKKLDNQEKVKGD